MELCDHLSIASQTKGLDSLAYCDFTIEPTENEPYSTIFYRAPDQKRCFYGGPAVGDSDMIRTEYRDSIPYYTVYDRNRCIVVYTTTYTVARDFEYFVTQGHTARTLLILARRQQQKTHKNPKR